MTANDEKKEISEILEIFTDGACTKNGSKDAIAGVGVFLKLEDPRNVSVVLEKTPHTNNRAELWAIKLALDIIAKETPKKAVIYTDSIYSKKALTEWIIKWKQNGWINSSKKPVSNKDMLELIDEQLNKIKESVEVTLVHVPGHSGEIDGNYYADKLATQALKSHQVESSSQPPKRQRLD